MDKITIDFLKQEIPALKQISTNYANELVDYFNKYCFSKNEVFFIYDALYKNNKKFHNIKKFLHYLKLQKINFKYFNCRLKRIIKLKKNSMSLIVFLLKYGKNKAYEFYENRKKNVGKTKQQYIEKFGIEEATKILKTKASSASLNNCIKKFGIDEGTKKWNNYLVNRAETYRINKKQGKYKGKYNLDWFISKYGKENGQKLYKQKINILFGYSLNLQKNKSKIADELFKSIHDLLLKKNININKIFYKAINKEYIVWITNKNRAYIDFYIKLKNGEKKLIEFYGDYWHANPSKYDDDTIIKKFGGHKTAKEIREKDTIREQLIYKKNKNLKIIWESDFKKNKEKIIMECFNFIIGVNNE